MRAITQRRYGTPAVLTVADVPAPNPGPADLLVEVHASVVSQGDRRLRAGDFPGITWLPGRLAMGLTGPRARVPGTTFAGRVAAVGADVQGFQVGDRVFGTGLSGAHAEHVRVPAAGPIAHLPAAVDDATAAVLPYGAGTALVFLRDILRLRAGEHVCVLGASGGVGRMAVQLAKHLGAEVTGVASGPNLALLRALGADHVVDYRREDFRRVGRRYDAVFDIVGASRWDLCREALAERGRYASLVVSARRLWQTAWTAALRRPQRSLLGVAMPGAQELREVADLAAAGTLRATIDARFGLEDVAAAHAHLEARVAPGAVVVEVRAPSPLPAAA